MNSYVISSFNISYSLSKKCHTSEEIVLSATGLPVGGRFQVFYNKAIATQCSKIQHIAAVAMAATSFFSRGGVVFAEIMLF